MSPIDRRLLTHANWPLVGFVVLLFCVGIVNLYSASAVRQEDGITLAPYFQRQLVWGAGGLVCMTACMLFDYRHLKNIALPFFMATTVLLALVLVIGSTRNGATRWLAFGSFTLQPSEAAKISMLLMGAALISRYKEKLGWIELFVCLLWAAPPCLLIFLQPDLGTTLLILMIIGGMFLYQGVKIHVLVFSAVAAVLSLPLLWRFVLHDYHKQRVMTFLDPSTDPQGAGYHILQSKIAIGSGEFWGKGFQMGTNHLLRFLPEKHTDFAVAVFSEEWGFAGCVVLMTLFCCFLLCMIKTVREAKDQFGSLICAGVFFYFFWQILINIGMVVGIMPVVGIPLPFISYGGTATLVNFSLLGLVLNVSMRRFMFKSS